jgi:cytochrome c biogenesis protein CcdA/thiol-disulfide isomerase/thioredoxin
MELALLITSFVAGILTVLAPCVLPLLPIIIGGSLSSKSTSQPYIITASLALSLTLFTLLLKASTLLINIDPAIWKYISGGLILVFGLTYILPNLWAKLTTRFKISSTSDQLLEKASEKQGILKSVLIGASLGPVFASCSPTYSLILATVLPVNFWSGVVYIIAYSLGLSLIMLLIALLGRSFVNKLKVFANPNGWFRKILGVLFIIVGVFIITGFDKTIETAILDGGFFDVTKVEQQILNNNMPQSSINSSASSSTDSSKLFNVTTPKPAPEITGIQDWINADPQTISNLKGKVVLVDFWTYSCINCQRTLPYVTKWYDTYKDQGFVVLGIHAPEFSFEKNKDNVQKFVNENGIHYPVGLDNSFATWNAYSNQFWPAQYLIDKEGNIRRTHFGEGAYDETEKAIRTLLAERDATAQLPAEVAASVASPKGEGQYCDPKTLQCVATTPETYLGYSRGTNFANSSVFKADIDTTYSLADSLNVNSWSVGGTWNISSESLTSKADGNTFKLKFNAKNVYIVMSGQGQGQVKVNGAKANFGKDVDSEGNLKIDGSRLYNIVSSDSYLVGGEVQITLPAGVSLNAITFG